MPSTCCHSVPEAGVLLELVTAVGVSARVFIFRKQF